MSAQRLVIFDLDGTLIDTVSLVVEAVTSAFNQLGHKVPDEKAIRSISGLGIRIGIKRIAPDVGEGHIDELAKLYKQEYLASATSASREKLFPRGKETLNALNGQDHTLLAVATGKPLVGTTRVLAAHNLTDLFTSIQTPDNNAAKPDPEMIFTAIDIVNGQKNTSVMIGDTTHDMEMSKQAGVKSVGVTWGYHTKDELIEAGASVLIDDFSELIDAIDSLTRDA